MATGLRALEWLTKKEAGRGFLFLVEMRREEKLIA
jgi:hypothetical protein